MKKIERRMLICRVLALLLAVGMGVFLVKYALRGGSCLLGGLLAKRVAGRQTAHRDGRRGCGHQLRERST